MIMITDKEYRTSMTGEDLKVGAHRPTPTAAPDESRRPETLDLSRQAVRLGGGAEGNVIDPDLHDAQLVSLAMEPFGIARIGVITNTGVRLDLFLEGVKKLRADRFSEGNTILALTMREFSRSEIDALPALYFIGPDADSSDPHFETIVTRAIHENWKIVEIDASYGCEVTALCESVTFARID